MNSEETEKSGIWIDALSFSVFLALAYFLRWEAHDLLWSLWLGSLVIGYLTILSSIGAEFYLDSRKGSPSTADVPVKNKGVLSGLFSLVFFTFHFGMFHFAHSVFLRNHFPLAEGLNDPSLSAFPQIIPPLLMSYGVFLIPALLTQRSDVWQIWKTTRNQQEGENENENGDPLPQKKRTNTMAKPYKNVMMMHVLIFVIAGLNHLELGNFFIYAVVYSAYFFPWRVLRG